MYCYNCGCVLTEHNFCTSCGVDVTVYKKIMYISNRYYNEGLARASVRDMTGAITSLRQCLKFNKNHIEARNLLGLVYFEMGEAVAALSQWVISKNIKPEKNIVDDYINMIQSNAGRVESITQTVKKYNQALLYCKQDSKDLAIIQLKKVLSINSKFMKAHLLLALLYMDSEQWEKAKHELKKCMDMDRNNVQALCYMKEVENMLAPEEGTKAPKQRKNEDVVRYQADNEIIIQPSGSSVFEPRKGGVTSLLNIALGIIIGVAVIYFFVVPTVKANVNNTANQKITEISGQLTKKDQEIVELSAQLQDMTEERNILSGKLDGYAGTDGTMQAMDSLLEAAGGYITSGEDVEGVASMLEKIRNSVVLEESSSSFQNLYNLLWQSISPKMAQKYYDEGAAAYESGRYEDAAAAYKLCVSYDDNNAEAYYQMGHSLRKLDRNEEASDAYRKVVELIPGTERADRAQGYINSMTAD